LPERNFPVLFGHSKIMSSITSGLLNPLKWFRAFQFQRRQKSFDKSSFDLELYLYSKILRNDMLHYGYFDNPDIDPVDLSIRQFEDAQVRYARKIMEHIQNKELGVLDVGCGMGGLSAMMLAENLKVEALTPNTNQVNYIRIKIPGLGIHHMKFEEFRADKKFGTIINSESLQYIRLEDAFENVENALAGGGRWIIADYFRTTDMAKHRSGHQMADFLRMAGERGWKIVYEEDISRHILPTIRYVYMYAERFLLPLKHFGFEKLRFKKPWLYYMTESIREKADAKIEKELRAVDPELFLNEKKYVLMVLERN